LVHLFNVNFVGNEFKHKKMAFVELNDCKLLNLKLEILRINNLGFIALL